MTYTPNPPVPNLSNGRTAVSEARGPGLGEIDYETAALIARLALEDLDELGGRSKGKGRLTAPLSDEEYALQLQSQQYQEFLSMSQDARIAKSLREASATDATYLEALIVAEQAAAEDRRAALALSRGEDLPVVTANQRRLEDPTFRVHPNDDVPSSKSASKMKAVSFDIDGDSHTLLDEENEVPNQHAVLRGLRLKQTSGASTSKGASSAGANIAGTKRVNCTICDDSVRASSALETTCGHHYCAGCIREHADLMTRDETLYPLRCCKVPMDHTKVFPFLHAALRKQFEAKNLEYSVPAMNRIYCCSPTCSAFLGATTAYEGVKGLRCGSCQTVTCPRCKQAYHPNERDCDVNTSTLELRAMARDQGWQTCPGCQAIVELNIGCYHMTCRCRTEFCYLCAVRWKNCTCSQWDEDRLVEAAHQRLENEMGGARAVQMRAAAPDRFRFMVEERAANLRVNHDCVTHQWRYRHGGGMCEECNAHLPNFLLLCRGCSMLACKRCTVNRL